MLDTLPYADLLAIHNALSEKPVRKFDTRANGVRRTEALLEARGLTLPEAALLTDVVLPNGDAVRDAPPSSEAADMSDETGLPREDAGHTNDEPRSDPPDQDAAVPIQVRADIAPLVNVFIDELMKPERPSYLATFLRRLNGGAVTRNPRETAGRQMTASQRKIVELCSRPEGATGKELAEGCGWPSIAARVTCSKLAERFGYTLEESPKANGRGISFRLTAHLWDAATGAELAVLRGHKDEVTSAVFDRSGVSMSRQSDVFSAFSDHGI
jgi:hypothetical protein